MLYGDSVEGALVEQADSGHGFLADLARSVIEGADVPDLGSLFRQVSLGGNGHSNATNEFIGAMTMAKVMDESDLAAGGDEALGKSWVLQPLMSTRQMTLFE